MRPGLSKILVTGGAGFIGSAFVRLLVKNGSRPIVLDKLTYAADPARLKAAGNKFLFYKADICDEKKLEEIFKRHAPRIVVNFAAETHVDRSILDSRAFIESNIKGVQVLLDAARRHKVEKFIHISTDEVYGDIEKGKFYEDSPLRPNSPYAASKAAGDLLIKAYIRTYGLPGIIIRPCNNYGPWQYPEKLIPRAILKVIKNEKIPIYAAGRNVREWLFVEDCVSGIYKIMQKGRPGQAYNLGSGDEKQNLEVARAILKRLKMPLGMIEFTKDRPGHDIRYSLSPGKTLREIGWSAKTGFNQGLGITVNWCLRHKDWLLSKSQDILKLYKQ